MQTTLNPIAAIKQSAADFISRHDAFKNIGVIVDEAGDVDTQIEIALQKLGIGVVIESNTGKVRHQNVGSDDIDLDVSITVTENVLINRDPGNTQASGKTASDLVVMLFAIFNPLRSKEPLPIVLREYEVVSNMGGVITYQITGTASAGWSMSA